MSRNYVKSQRITKDDWRNDLLVKLQLLIP